MFKNFFVSIMVVSVLAVVLPAAAVAKGPTAAQITCVGSAVSARETALGSAIAVYTQAVSAAYSARATALQAAYGKTNVTDVKSAVKAAWSVFNSSMKSARRAWQTSRNDAWSKFRTAVRACKATGVPTDSANSSSEAIGQ